MINSGRRVIGQLLGPGACPAELCNTEPDLEVVSYGKFDVSWTGNADPDERRRLDHWLHPGEGQAPMTINGKTGMSISGPDYLCSTNTFTLQNAPAGSMVNWIAGPGNLFSDNPPSGSGTSATLSPYSSFASGQATITFTIENPCGVELEVQQSFWVGRPSAPGPIMGNTNPSTGSLATYLVASQPPGATSMNWVLPFCFGCSQPWSFWSGQNSTQMVAQVGDPFGYVQAMGSNPCGSGGASLLYVTPDGSGCGSCPIQIVHPNPASEELMLSFVDPEDGRTMTAEVEPYEVSLYDMHGARIFEGKGKEPVFRMDVSRLKNGFYYLHVLNRYGLTRKQIRVER